MELKVYKKPEIFWNEVSPHLMKDAATNNLLLGLSKSFIENPINCIYQGAVFEGGDLIAVLTSNMHSGSCKVIASETNSVEAAQLLLSSFLSNGVSPQDIIAHKETAFLYSELFKANGFNFELRMPQGVYRCSSVKIPETKKDFKFELAQLKDVETVSDWMLHFLKDVSLEDETPKDMTEAARKSIENQSFFILSDGGEPVSLAGWGRDIGESCVVNFVYTPNKYRRRGYGSLISALLTDKLLSEGKKEVHLYTDLNNSTSNKIYQAIGYEFVCESVNLRLREQK